MVISIKSNPFIMLSSLFFYTNKPMIIILTDRVTFVYVEKSALKMN